MADNTGLQFTFTARSLAATALSVISFELNEGLSEVFELNLELATEREDIGPDLRAWLTAFVAGP